MQKSLKTWLLLFLIISFMFTLVACGGTPEKQETGTQEPGTQEPSQTTEPIKWKYQSYNLASGAEYKASKAFADEVRKRTDGKLDITVYEAGTLGYSGYEIHKAVADGLLDAGVTMAAAVATDIPAFDAADLPFLFKQEPGYDKCAPRLAIEEAHDIYQEMADTLGLKYFNMFNNADNLYSTKEVMTLEDWKGLKFRSWSQHVTDIATITGGSAQTIDRADLYSALTGNIIDSCIGDAETVVNQLSDVIKYYSYWGVMASQEVLLINQKSWDALDKETQDIITDVVRDQLNPELYAAKWDANWTYAKDMEAKGIKVATPPAEEVAKLRALCKEQLWEPWLEKAGDNGKRLLAIFEKYQ